MNVFLMFAALAVAGVLQYGYGKAAAVNRIELDRNLTPLATDAAGGRVINILLVGSDSSEGLDPDDPIQIGRQGERFGDVIIIAHLDERTGQIALLSLPRDLWVTMAGTSTQRRINAAFLVGGPATLIDTIETNFDLPIHHYVNVDFAGFQGLVAAVGTVEVYFDTPARDWDITAKPVPRSRTGFIVETAGCHSLDPEQALAYVRSRYYQTLNADGEWVTDPTADLGRIRRQQDFLRNLLAKSIEVGARNPFVLSELVETGLDNVVVDQQLTGQLLVDLGATYRSFDPELLQTYSLPVVDDRVGTDQVLMTLDRDAEPILELFRGAATSDPGTVRLVITTDLDDADPRLTTITDVLTGAGFDPTMTSGEGEPGTVVRHGPDGRQAAELVVHHLAQAGQKARIEQVGHLLGRSIEVLIGDDALTGDDVPIGDDAASNSTDEPDSEPAGDKRSDVTGQKSPVPGGSASDSTTVEERGSSEAEQDEAVAAQCD